MLPNSHLKKMYGYALLGRFLRDREILNEEMKTPEKLGFVPNYSGCSTGIIL